MKFTTISTFVLVSVQLSSVVYSSTSAVRTGTYGDSSQITYIASVQWGLPPFIRFKHVCTGTIIKHNWILTAGSCVIDKLHFGNYKVKVGLYDVLHENEYVQAMDTEKVFVHKDYVGGIAPNDIALIKLKVSVVFNEYVSSIGLPRQDQVIINTNATLSGWGTSCDKWHPKYRQIIKSATVPVVTNEECQRVCKLIHDLSTIYNNQLCTIAREILTVSPGDTGSPLVQDIMGNAVQVGILSWNLLPCGSAIPSPNVYTRLTSYVDWINVKITEA